MQNLLFSLAAITFLSSAQAAPNLSATLNPKLESSLKEAGPVTNVLYSGHVRTLTQGKQRMESPAEKNSWRTVMENKMDLDMQMQIKSTLANEKIQKVEFEFEKLQNKLEMKIASTPPRKMNSNLDKYMRGMKILAERGTDGEFRFPSLDAQRNAVAAKIKDPQEAQMLLGILSEKSMLQAIEGIKPDAPPFAGSCLEKLGGKKIGENWEATLEAPNVGMVTINCTFRGWAKQSKGNLALVEFTSKPIETKREVEAGAQGQPAHTVLFRGKITGNAYYHPATKEAIIKQSLSGSSEMTPKEGSPMRSHANANFTLHTWPI